MLTKILHSLHAVNLNAWRWLLESTAAQERLAMSVVRGPRRGTLQL